MEKLVFHLNQFSTIDYKSYIRKIQYGDVTLDSDTVRVHVLFFFAPVDVAKEVLDFCVLGEERNDYQKTSGLCALDVHFWRQRAK